MIIDSENSAVHNGPDSDGIPIAGDTPDYLKNSDDNFKMSKLDKALDKAFGPVYDYIDGHLFDLQETLGNMSEKSKKIGKDLLKIIEDSSDKLKVKVKNVNVKDSVKNASDWVKENVDYVSERAYEIPGVNRIIAEIQIAGNQDWVDKYDKKANKYKEKLDGIDIDIENINNEMERINETRDTFLGSGLSNSKIRSLDKEIEKREKSIRKLEEKREKPQKKYDESISRKNEFIEERNEIADKLINFYQEKINPIEKRVRASEISVDKADFSLEVVKIDVHDKERKLKELEEKNENYIQITKKSKLFLLFDSTVNGNKKLIKDGHKEVKLVYERIEDDTEELAKRREKIEKINKKADPYRDKLKIFQQVKKWNSEEEFLEPEENVVEKRIAEFNNFVDKKAAEHNKESVKNKTYGQAFPLEEQIGGWNEFLIREKVDADVDIYFTINQKEFLEINGFLNGHMEITDDDFLRLVKKYQRLRIKYKFDELY